MVETEKILREVEEISKNQFLPIIGPVKGELLAKLITKKRPGKVLEVGTLVGYSAMLMAMYMPGSSSIVTIEKSKGLAGIAKRNIAGAGLSKRIRVIHGDALDVIPKLKEKFGLVFLDAEKSEYLDYLKLAESRMAKKCIVVADNVKIFANTLSDYLDYVRNNYKSRMHDFGFDAMEVSERK